MAQRLRPVLSERGQAGFTVVLTLVAVILAGILVNRVAWTAESINEKAGRISKTAVPIGVATKAVAGGNLDKTNQLAGSILETARPLQGKLNEIVTLARSVDRLAVSINASAADIDGTAKGINSNAAGILGTAQSIDRGVKQIIANLNVTIGIVQAVRGDAGNILAQAQRAHAQAACIDQGLAAAGGSADGHCR